MQTRDYFVGNFEKALKEGWIKAYHQPLVRAASRRVSDEEAFARWQEPGGELYSASEFIPALEEAGLVYKLDLYIVKQILVKMKAQQDGGLFVVPESVNLSKSDFKSCDIVEEIKEIVDESGISRDKLCIEISERTVASDTEYMAEQIKRFRKLGFKVWMDDYGSGYSSLLILLNIKFDLLKIDKIFVDQISKGDDAKIILTEIVKTAITMGMETVAEGVETKEQANFLKEIGCTKLQGNYYCKPVSADEVFERNDKGIQIGFENPSEVDYYAALGRVSLYDLSISLNDTKEFSGHFDTMPMVIFAVGGDKATFIRCNNSYREFVRKYFPSQKKRKAFEFDSIPQGTGYYSFNAVRQCALEGKRMIIDDRTKDGVMVQMFLRRVAVNPVSSVAAVAIVVLSASEGDYQSNLSYNYVARVLSQDYVGLYFVNLDTSEFTEYIADGNSRDISVERRGEDFFNTELDEAKKVIHPDDIEMVEMSFSKANIERDIDEHGVYSITYRQLLGNDYCYVNLKAVKLRKNSNQVIIGLSNVDAQMRQREVFERLKEERLIYSRIGALSGDIIYIFTVDPVTEHFTEYNPAGIRSDFGIEAEGDGFFNTVINGISRGIYVDDAKTFKKEFTKNKVFKDIEKNGAFINDHRLNIEGKPRYVRMKAVLLDEEGEKKLIIGIIDIDAQVRKDQEYEKNLSAANARANFDELTGVRNKHAYAEIKDNLDRVISDGISPEFAMVVFDLNGLKLINDTLGHQAGDQFIKKGCDAICKIFKRSPVFRVGGDEFVVIAQGEDYRNIDDLMETVGRTNESNMKSGDVVIAAGMARYRSGDTVGNVFKKADERMYFNKKMLKAQ